MAAIQPDFQNKTSFDNYIYYKMIREKIKYQKGLLVLFELLFIYNSFNFYWLGYGKLFMPALYVLIIKDIYLVVSSSRKKILISLVLDIAAMMIMIAQAIYYENSAGILDVVATNIFFYPALLLHVRNFKNTYIEDKLSSLKDYPFFSLDLHKPDEEAEYNEFTDDTGDKLLKTAMLDAYTENKSKKIRIIKLCILAAAAITFCIFISAQSMINKLNDTKTYLPDKTYLKEEYVNVDVLPDTKQTAVTGEGQQFWINVNNTDKYIYIRCSESTFKKISGDKPVNIKGKLKLASEGELENATLSLQVFKTAYSFISEEQKSYLDSVSNRNLYIQMTDEDVMRDRAFYCIIFTLILGVAYGLLIILPRKNEE